MTRVYQTPPVPRPTKAEPQAQPSQSTNIVPVKGMMSVESIDFSDDEQHQQQQPSMPPPPVTENLDSLMADLGNMVKPRTENSTEINVCVNKKKKKKKREMLINYYLIEKWLNRIGKYAI